MREFDHRQIRDFRVLRWKTRDSPRVDEVIPLATVVEPRELRRFLGTRDDVAIRRHLQRLRSDGVLIARPGRLQTKVRGHGGLCYVFRGPADTVPRVGRMRERARVGTWQ